MLPLFQIFSQHLYPCTLFPIFFHSNHKFYIYCTLSEKLNKNIRNVNYRVDPPWFELHSQFSLSCLCYYHGKLQTPLGPVYSINFLPNMSEADTICFKGLKFSPNSLNCVQSFINPKCPDIKVFSATKGGFSGIWTDGT